ncbi:hypothetical protein SISNIDRAFT_455394 [Sistotremastrum niveocremeum HHB9708]|uniref:Uncharacterized protein n=2 Tax=Sistotremastraceae TaxID=3402574 RepID=A0A164TZI9_9AGAM|nr:hypothetical protein SISNIDRAFT_455394 [Sistotremastrum niveocremeum HHB9708]KZT35504.1 hypothetical protein SISSUDRAFT_1051299 [Sistotremastrum suecicum HHB10207 ss-3]
MQISLRISFVALCTLFGAAFAAPAAEPATTTVVHPVCNVRCIPGVVINNPNCHCPA